MSKIDTLNFMKEQFKGDLIRYEAKQDYLGIKRTKKKLKFIEKEIKELKQEKKSR